MTLTREQELALVEAMGHDEEMEAFADCLRTSPPLRPLSLDSFSVFTQLSGLGMLRGKADRIGVVWRKGREIAIPYILTPAGRIVAQLIKERDEARGVQVQSFEQVQEAWDMSGCNPIDFAKELGIQITYD